jgi:hypothetical protein
MLKLFELGGGWELRNEFKQFQGQTVKFRKLRGSEALGFAMLGGFRGIGALGVQDILCLV